MDLDPDPVPILVRKQQVNNEIWQADGQSLV